MFTGSEARSIFLFYETRRSIKQSSSSGASKASVQNRRVHFAVCLPQACLSNRHAHLSNRAKATLIPERCSDEKAHEMMEQIIPARRYFELHINLIRHGRQICRPSQPRCEECCVVDYCSYYSRRPSRAF